MEATQPPDVEGDLSRRRAVTSVSPINGAPLAALAASGAVQLIRSIVPINEKRPDVSAGKQRGEAVATVCLYVTHARCIEDLDNPSDGLTRAGQR